VINVQQQQQQQQQWRLIKNPLMLPACERSVAGELLCGLLTTQALRAPK